MNGPNYGAAAQCTTLSDCGNKAESAVEGMIAGLCEEQARTISQIEDLSRSLSMVRNIAPAMPKAESSPKPVAATDLLRQLDNMRERQRQINAMLSELRGEVVL